MMTKAVFMVFFGILFGLSFGNPSVSNYIGYCIKSKYHKPEPSIEMSLSQCAQWRQSSCCTVGTSEQIHTTELYNFTFNHCTNKKNMSSRCLTHFIQDLCFYECSPNVGPWVIKAVNKTLRKERFYKVPLCKLDCDAWFEDCADDYTCTDNWTVGFIRKNGINSCPENSSCATFQEVFGSAKNFCEKVWDDSWQYTEDNESCMKLWFDGNENPNIRVAQLKSMETSDSKISADHSSIFTVFIAMFFMKQG